MIHGWLTDEPMKCLECGSDLPTPRNIRTTRCAPCQQIYSKAYHKAFVVEWTKKKRETTPQYFQKDYEKHNAYRRRKLVEDPDWAEKRRSDGRQSREREMADPERREKHREYQREWRESHREHTNAYVHARFRQLRLEVLAAYGGRCECCGENREPFLCIDHINGGGGKHKAALKKLPGYSGGNGFYKWLKGNGFPSGFRVLCHNCNMSLGFYGFCPHQEEHKS